MIVLRDYQERCIQAARRTVAGGSRAVCVVAPTGSGKTVIGSAIAASGLARGGRWLWLAHRRELIDQTVESLARAGVDRVSVLRADDDRFDSDAPIVVASIQTLVARGTRPEARGVILDECHHLLADVWRSVADDYRDAIRIGLTATPERADGSPLGDLFDSLVVAASYPELIRAGHLCPCAVLSPKLRLRGEIAADPGDAYVKDGGGRPAVIFTATVPQAREIATRLPRAACIDAGTPGAERESLVARFRAGDLDVLTNCFVLTEGFDAPRAEVAVIGRGCSHASTWIQICGRVLRPAPGKSRALVIDLAGAVHKHGFPTEDREYSLEGQAIRRLLKPESLWQCTFCGHVQPVAPFDRVCPECGTPLPDQTRPDVANATLHLQVAWTCPQCQHDHCYMPICCLICGHFSPRGTRCTGEPEEQKQEYLARMRGIARDRGYKPGWAAWKYKSKYGRWPAWRTD